jgi:hypothetical protein
MDIHDNARTTRHSRMLMIERLARGWAIAAVASAQGSHPKPCASGAIATPPKGETGPTDRSSRPHRGPRRLPEPADAAIVTLRHHRLSGPAIARRLGHPLSTVGVVPRRHPSRLASLGRIVTPLHGGSKSSGPECGTAIPTLSNSAIGRSVFSACQSGGRRRGGE